MRTKEQKSLYLKEWRAKKLLEDPDYDRRRNRKAWLARPEDVKVKYRTEKARYRLQNREAATATTRAHRLANPEHYLNYGRRWRAENAVRVKQRAKEYRVENADQIATRVKQWNVTNRGKVLAYGRKWHAAHPGRSHAKNMAYLAAHPGKSAEYANRRRALKLNSAGSHTAEDLRQLLIEHRGLCAYCSEPANTVDHVVPLSRGGSNSKDNLVPACKSCNSRKKDRTPQEWIGAGNV